MRSNFSTHVRRWNLARRLTPYLLCAAFSTAAVDVMAQQPTSGIVPGTDVVIYDDDYFKKGEPPAWVALGRYLADMQRSYENCSQGYVGYRNDWFNRLSREAERGEAKMSKLLAAGKPAEAADALRYASDTRRLIGWLPPANLPEPCPPENPPAFTIAGTGIKLYDFELAAKWGQKLTALRGRQTTCPGYPNVLQQTKDELAADAAAREKALDGSLTPATRASLETDRDGLKQLEGALHSPCVVPPRATPGASVQKKPKATKRRASARTRTKKAKPKAASKPLDRDTARAVEFGIGVGLGILSNQGNRGGQNRQQNWNNQ